jgi:hypothetical protein
MWFLVTLKKTVCSSGLGADVLQAMGCPLPVSGLETHAIGHLSCVIISDCFYHDSINVCLFWCVFNSFLAIPFHRTQNHIYYYFSDGSAA